MLNVLMLLSQAKGFIMTGCSTQPQSSVWPTGAPGPRDAGTAPGQPPDCAAQTSPQCHKPSSFQMFPRNTKVSRGHFHFGTSSVTESQVAPSSPLKCSGRRVSWPWSVCPGLRKCYKVPEFVVATGLPGAAAATHSSCLTCQPEGALWSTDLKSL